MSPERPPLSNDGGPTIFDASMIPTASATTTILSHYPIETSVITAEGGINQSAQQQQHSHHFILQNPLQSTNNCGSNSLLALHNQFHHHNQYNSSSDNNNNSSVSLNGGGNVNQILPQASTSPSPTNFNNNNNSSCNSKNGNSSSNMTALTSSIVNTSASSKLLVLQHHHHHHHQQQQQLSPIAMNQQNMNGYIATDNFNRSNSRPQGPQHIGGNIVLLATESLDITNSEHDVINNNLSNGNSMTVTTTDEELTPLHWLHDKNLLKGINLSCNKNSSCPDSPRHSSGRLSPTSDFVEDSSVSEDNNSSINSATDQNNIVYERNNNNNNYCPAPQNLTMKNRAGSMSTLNVLSPSKSPITVVSEYRSVIGYATQPSVQCTMSSTLSPTPSSASSTISLGSYTSSSPFSSSSPVGTVLTIGSSATSASSNNNSNVAHYNHKKYLREEYTKQVKQETGVEDEPRNFASPVNYSATTMSTKNDSNTKHVGIKMENLKMESDYEDYSNSTTYKTCFNSTQSSVCSSPVASSEPDILVGGVQYNEPFVAKGNSNNNSMQNKVKHPTNIPYDPLLHTDSKPPYSFSCLIFMAIEDSPTKALPVKEIYSWITAHFPYFKTAPNGWKNSVRHNLSLNKSFQKVEKAANLGKGSLWMVDEQYRPNLIQALTRSPFHPCSSIEKSVYRATNSMPTSATLKAAAVVKERSVSPSSKTNNSRLPNPEHFPFLARRLAAMDGNKRATDTVDDDSRVWRADSIDDVNAAAAMLALKHGPKFFAEVFPNGHPPIVTTSPSGDHTYSSAIGNRSSSSSDANSNGTSSDAAYESGDDGHNQLSNEQEEQRRLAEGADALLNLAGITTNYSSSSSSAQSTPLKRSASDSDMQSSYYSAANQTNITHNYSAPPKKHKSRMLKAKLKRKASWLR